MSWAPHPNPPPLVFPPLCVSPAIGGMEPTSVDTTVTNLLLPGATPLGIPDACLPPQGLLTPEQNGFFQGPSLPASDVSMCSTYALRQQIGHFLYLCDRVAGEVVVLNSNRMTVLDRIPQPDPTSLAMSPDLDFLAVTNQAAGTVSFISTDPNSSNFHQVVKVTSVGKSPTGITWESGNEDVFVCNSGDNTVSIISAFSLAVRKTLSNQLSGPFEVVTTPRQLGFGLFRGVYYAYILNSNGTVSLFESGPDGVNGWGFDEIIGQPEFTFDNPTDIAVDVSNINSAIWVAHQNPLDFDGSPTGQTGGALSNMVLESGTIGIIPLDPGFFANPSLRDLNFAINASVGEGRAGPDRRADVDRLRQPPQPHGPDQLLDLVQRRLPAVAQRQEPGQARRRGLRHGELAALHAGGGAHLDRRARRGGRHQPRGRLPALRHQRLPRGHPVRPGARRPRGDGLHEPVEALWPRGSRRTAVRRGPP